MAHNLKKYLVIGLLPGALFSSLINAFEKAPAPHIEYLGMWPTYDTVATKLPGFLRYYNGERRHMGIGYQTPEIVIMSQRY
jgi:hypothetical protein